MRTTLLTIGFMLLIGTITTVLFIMVGELWSPS